jgi:D-serine deaminase-like pyridoxal phosphate-dependent protein
VRELSITGDGARASAPLDLDTPIPVVDLDVVENNIRQLQEACDAAGVFNRPHIKTHKSVQLAKLQQKFGAKGITCQKLGEAEVMADAGFTDILISYNIIGEAKRRRIAALCDRIDLTVSCDSKYVADELSRAVGESKNGLRVLVECDTGRHRCGVLTAEAAIELAHYINDLAGLSFSGLLVYPPSDKVETTKAFIDEIRMKGTGTKIKLATISAGGTPNIARVGQVGETEYRAGTYIYNDRQMVSLGAAKFDDCAFFVHATVVSRPEPGRAMIDAGSKALTSDLMGFRDFGLLIDYPGARIYELAEEHGFVDVSACQQKPVLGEVVRVLPNHVCAVSNLFDRLCLTRGGQASGTIRVDARGCVT